MFVKVSESIAETYASTFRGIPQLTFVSVDCDYYKEAAYLELARHFEKIPL